MDSAVNQTVARSAPREAWGAGWLRALLEEPVPKTEMGLFFERLAALLGAGMLVPEALRRAAASASASAGPELRAICERAAGPVGAGVPLHRALAPWRDRLPEITLPVLEVGETAGTLEGSARRLSEAFLGTAAVERRFRYSVFDWRLIVLLLALQNVGMALSASPMAALARFLVSLAELALLFLAGRMALRFLFRWPAMRFAVDTVKLAVPHFGAVARNLAAARWARSFATLWQAGVPVSEALEVSSRSALNARYERALLRAAARTRQGQGLADSLADADLLPRYLLDVLRTGETTGRFAETLDRFVVLLEDEALTLATQELAAVVVALKILSALAMVAMLSA